MQLKLIQIEVQVNYSFASGNDPSSDYRNNTELKTKGKKLKDKDTWQTTGTDRRSVASKLSYLGVSDAPIGCSRTTGLVPGSTKVIYRPGRRKAGKIGRPLTGLVGGRARCT